MKIGINGIRYIGITKAITKKRPHIKITRGEFAAL